MTKNCTLIYLVISSCLLCELLRKLFVRKLADPNHQFQWFGGGKQSEVTLNVQPEIDGHWVLGCARYICTCNPYWTFQFCLSLGDWHGHREGSTEEFTSLLTCGRLPAKFSFSHLFEIRPSTLKYDFPRTFYQKKKKIVKKKLADPQEDWFLSDTRIISTGAVRWWRSWLQTWVCSKPGLARNIPGHIKINK